jgi:hypothetical protein
MTKPVDPKASIEELTISNMYEIEALIEVLAIKGIISKEEVLEEIKRMRGKMVDKL